MRISAVNYNPYSKISSSKSVNKIAFMAQDSFNSNEYDYKKSNKIYRKTILKNKILTCI